MQRKTGQSPQQKRHPTTVSWSYGSSLSRLGRDSAQRLKEPPVRSYSHWVRCAWGRSMELRGLHGREGRLASSFIGHLVWGEWRQLGSGRGNSKPHPREDTTKLSWKTKCWRWARGEIRTTGQEPHPHERWSVHIINERIRTEEQQISNSKGSRFKILNKIKE